MAADEKTWSLLYLTYLSAPTKLFFKFVRNGRAAAVTVLLARCQKKSTPGTGLSVHIENGEGILD
jgi:hypothetical protein